MKIKPDFKVTAEITLNNEEAKIIEHLTSYDILKEFAARFSHEFTIERMDSVLKDLRSKCKRINDAHRDAINTISKWSVDNA